MSNVGRANRSLAHFAVLLIFGITVTLFLVHKANQMIAEFDTIKEVYDAVQ